MSFTEHKAPFSDLGSVGLDMFPAAEEEKGKKEKLERI